MKKRSLFKRIVGGITCLAVILSHSAGGITSFAENKFEYFSQLDSNCEEYKQWKSNLSNEATQDSSLRLRKASTANSVSNEYLDLVYSVGNYSLGTVEGDPAISTDNNQRLLYGYPGSGTSYTTIQIDKTNYKFSPQTVTYTENTISASAVYGDISVMMNFSLISNQYTGRDDVAEFSYTVSNMGETSHNVGVRIMFDTMLGNNDSSPFRIPTIGDTSSETDLSGNDVPEFWQSFDSLTSPNVIAQGTIKSNTTTSPDRVRFTNWANAYNNPWDYSRALGASNGDSAVCVYWNPRNLSNGSTLNCSTYYGLSTLQQDGTPPLAVALTGATKLGIEHSENETDSYTPNPFTITAYIQNVGDGEAKNVSARLNLPSGMSIVEGNEIVELGDLPVNSKQQQVAWKVWVEPNPVSTSIPYSVTVTAANADAKTLQRSVEVPALQTNGPLKLYFYRSKLDLYSNNLNIDFKLENSSKTAVDLNNYIVRYYFIDENPDLKKEIDTYYCGNPNNNNVNIKISYHSIPAPYKSNANAYLEFDFSKSKFMLSPDDTIRVNCAMHTKNWSSIDILNDFSALDNNYNDETGLILWTKIPIYEKNSNKKVWGSEPKDSSEDIAPAMSITCSADTLSNDSIVNMVITLKNTSSTPIYLSDSKLVYYYTNDNNYAQNVNVYYAGGRINGDWIAITDKVKGKAEPLETKKDRADSIVTIEFSSISGALCYNESVDIHLQISNENWKQGKFVLSNDYSYDGITDTNFVANNIIFTANYLNKKGNYAEYQYGDEISDYVPTYSAFKIGYGEKSKNTIKDYEAFINGMENGFNAVKYSDYAIGHNFDSKIEFTKDNMRAILESDVAYISGHGYFGGVLPIFHYHDKTESDSMLTANYNVKNNQYGLHPNPEKDFSFKVSENDSDVNGNLQWLIFGACSQLNDGPYDEKHTDDIIKFDDQYTYVHWLETLLSNNKMKGILGYYGDAPSASFTRSDKEVIKLFLNYSKNNNVKDAWFKANAFNSYLIIEDSLRCGLLVKDDWANKKLYDTLIDTSKVNGDIVYLYKAVLAEAGGVEYPDSIVYGEEFNSNEILNAVNLYAAQNNISINSSYTPVINEISRKILNSEGECIGNELVEYTVSFAKINESNTDFSEKNSMVRSYRSIIPADEFDTNGDLTDISINSNVSDTSYDEHNMDQDEFDTQIYEFEDFVFSYDPTSQKVEVL